MLQPNSRVSMEDGIKFYEQDIVYDNYIYMGDFDIALNLEYCNSGFGIGLCNSEGQMTEKENSLLFKMGSKNVDVILLNKDTQKTLATYSSAYAKTYTKDLKCILQKRDATFSLFIGEQKVCLFKSPNDFDSYNLFYYSNSGNIIKNINIASSIPYGWTTNMQNTNGGYIWFYRDGFEFKHCQGEAEIEQSDIYLNYGTYYLKYETDEDCDIIPYVFSSEDERLLDKRKNILNVDNSFTLDYSQKICLKFEGTKGKIKKICITNQKDNEYYRTSPDKGDSINIDGSQIKLILKRIKEFELDFVVKHAPGSDHNSPTDYHILNIDNLSWGLFDLNIAQNVKYTMKYSKTDGYIFISNKFGSVIKPIKLNNVDSLLTIFKNVNAIITSFNIVDINNNSNNIIVENTIKKSVPSTIYSPIIVVDELEHPLDLSASYRVYNKNNKDYYWFTNVEREYFKPNNLIKLTNQPSFKNNTVIVYGIKKASKVNFENILRIPKEGLDTIDAFANIYDILFEKDLRYINKQTKEIRLTDISDYEWIVVDYLKENSYAINYRHNLNSYEVDISIEDNKKNKLIYNNAAESKDDVTYINEYRYVNTKAVPSENCYIVIGR